MTQPSFNLEEIAQTYQPPTPDRVRQIQQLLEKHGFIDTPDTTAFIGLGGTISSAYSYNQETIVVGPYRVAARIVTALQEKFAVNQDVFTAIDLFAKDSRTIKNEDLILLLDVLHTFQNKRVLITCGTYMLPRIAELVMQVMKSSGKIIGLTGALLPLGFADSDATQNVISTLTVVNAWDRMKPAATTSTFVCFHGHIYDNLKSLRTLDLHPKSKKDAVIAYPMSTVPVDVKSNW